LGVFGSLKWIRARDGVEDELRDLQSCELKPRMFSFTFSIE